MPQLIRNYSGWKVLYYPNRPTSGKYVAERYGVCMSGRTEEEVIRMIELRIKEYPPNSD